MVLFFGSVELALYLVGIQPILVKEDPYVGFQSSLKLFEPSEDRQEMRTASNKLRHFNRQAFPRHKGPNSFRIFTVGGSTTYGRPYDDATSFSAWLRAYLTALDPDRQWEVVNGGGISYASYRVALLMEELIEYEPDLFIIYSGNNEFLESRTYPELKAEPALLTRTRLLLSHSRLWALGSSFVRRTKEQARERYELTGEVSTLLDKSAGLDYYHRDDEFEDRVLKHYRFNLERMVTLAHSVGPDVIFVTVPVNESDFSPFKSQHGEGLSTDEQATVSRLLEETDQALLVQDWRRALELADQALGIDPRYAESHFARGKALMGLNAFDDAEASFLRAIAEDVCPLRASDKINEAILQVSRLSGTGLVDFRELLKSSMADIYGHRILGDKFFLDHVHPSVEAHGKLAAALVDEIASLELLQLASDWRLIAQETVEHEILSRIDAEATSIANKNLSKVLLWAGKNREAEKYLRIAEESDLEDWEVYLNAAMAAIRVRQDYEAAFRNLDRALRLRPESARAHDLLGTAYLLTGQIDQAIEAANKAVSLDPNLPSAWKNLSIAYLQANELGRALQAVQRALELDPRSAEALNTQASVQLLLGQPTEALDSARLAISIKGGDFPKAKVNAGFALGDLGRYEEARIYFLDAVATDPDEIMALLGLSQTLLLLGQPTDAIPHLEKVLKLSPGNQAATELKSRALLAVTSDS